MRSIISFMLLFCTFSLFAQTPIISHKSHAGSYTTFFIDPNSNFGEIYMPPTVYKEAVTENFVHWELLDDSTIVKQVTDSNQRVISVDYISNKEKLSIDYFKFQYHMQQQHIQDSIRYEEYKKQQEEKHNEVILPVSPNNGNTPPFIFIMALVSVAGMVIYRIFFSETRVASAS